MRRGLGALYPSANKSPNRAAPKSQPGQEEMRSAARGPPGRGVGHQAAVAEKPLGYVSAQLCLQAYSDGQ